MWINIDVRFLSGSVITDYSISWMSISYFFLIHMCSASVVEGNGSPLQYSCRENPVDGGAWWAPVHRVTWGDLGYMHTLEKEMATHSSVLTWRIPGTEEPGGLPSKGLHRVGHDWSDLAAASAVHWMRAIAEVLDYTTSL